ncbi:MAG: hypothetical protein LBP37_02460 [Spirochaetaceae bacterium]|nr:hypothetical protein [Spirochaetaceae bacterium]
MSIKKLHDLSKNPDKAPRTNNKRFRRAILPDPAALTLKLSRRLSYFVLKTIVYHNFKIMSICIVAFVLNR